MHNTLAHTLQAPRKRLHRPKTAQTKNREQAKIDNLIKLIKHEAIQVESSFLVATVSSSLDIEIEDSVASLSPTQTEAIEPSAKICQQ